MNIKDPRIKISISTEEELISPSEYTNCREEVYDVSEFEKIVNGMVERYGQWGWCTVRVKAWVVVPGFASPISESEYLGCCSYQSQKDFEENSGYCEQMIQDAKKSLVDSIETMAKNLNRLNEGRLWE